MQEKSTQCNTVKRELDSLRSELDLFQASDGNNKSKGVSLNNVNSVIRSVLSLVDIEISDLPSKSTVGNVSSEVGLVAQQHLNEVLASPDNFTMQRDATTKKGHHYYASQLTTAENTFTVGVAEVIDGKATTYVSCVNETLTNICNPGTVLNKVSSYMTDRSATEQKWREYLVKLTLNLNVLHTVPLRTVESKLLYKNNKTAEWLNEKKESEKGHIINKAVRSNAEFINNSKLKQKKLHKNKIKVIEERHKVKTKREEKKRQYKCKMLKDLETIGIWKNEKIIEENTGKIRTKIDKVMALKSQINMVKEHINLGHNNKHLTQFSKKGKEHDTKDLVDNLVCLINLMNDSENGKNKETEALIMTIRNQPSGIVGKCVSHTWSDQTRRGKVLSFNDREFEIRYWDSILPENTGETLTVFEANHVTNRSQSPCTATPKLTTEESFLIRALDRHHSNLQNNQQTCPVADDAEGTDRNARCQGLSRSASSQSKRSSSSCSQHPRRRKQLKMCIHYNVQFLKRT
ncbi:unnamed protein product [Mytilus coruscus]|uniref:Uncharacterized protein n=1 Tax=Mytilus coruscus TaxID=42192 RepID=A0A6J8BKQ9_MYTCO|nr:unnamed protein product [Mytilus coruscus]